MSLTWKDAAATVGVVLAAGVVISLLSGMGEAVTERWMYGSVLLFVIASFTALLTGTAYLMERAWTSAVTYALAVAVVLITIVNLFLNSQAWFIALAVAIGLMWLEFILVHLFSQEPGVPQAPTSRGAAV